MPIIPPLVQPSRSAVLLAVAALGRPLFALFAHPSAAVREAAARLMRVVALEGALLLPRERAINLLCSRVGRAAEECMRLESCGGSSFDWNLKMASHSESLHVR